MSDIMSSFEEKTSFDELKARNQRLETELEFANNCLIVLIEFKNVFNRLIDTKSKPKIFYLKEEDIQELEELNEKYDKVLADKQIKSEVNEENTKELFVSQNIDSLNSLNRSTNESLILKPQMITVQNNGSDTIPGTTILYPPNTKLVVKCVKLRTDSSIGSSNSINKLPNTRMKTSNSNIKGVDHDTNNTTIDIPTKTKTRQRNNTSFKCIVNNCNKIYESYAILKCHQRERHLLFEQTVDINYIKCYICDYTNCGKDCGNAKRLGRHRRVHSSVSKYKCDFVGCEKTFKERTHLTNHFKIHSDGPYFHCSYNDCEYKSKLKGSLTAHEKTHSKNKPFKCEFNGCGVRCKTKTSLKGHHLTHNNENPVLCPVKDCGKLIKPRFLENHLQLHTKEEVSCDYPECQYKHKVKSYVERHKRRVHALGRNFACVWPECGKSFKSNADLLVHMRRHTVGKRFSCEWPGCEYRSMNLPNLKRHLRTHTKEKPFACVWPGCDYRCAIEHSLKKHREVNHKD